MLLILINGRFALALVKSLMLSSVHYLTIGPTVIGRLPSSIERPLRRGIFDYPYTELTSLVKTDWA